MGRSPLKIWFKIEGYVRGGGKLALIASIEHPQLIANILSHMQRMTSVPDRGIARCAGAGVAGTLNFIGPQGTDLDKDRPHPSPKRR
jgi:hypothetical protein